MGICKFFAQLLRSVLASVQLVRGLLRTWTAYQLISELSSAWTVCGLLRA